MACFLVPAAEAAVVTVLAYGLKAKEKKAPTLNDSAEGELVQGAQELKVAVSTKLLWLARLLWGGCLLLCYEHVWHGEIVPWFPFLTAAADPGDTAVMLEELRMVGGAMAVALTAAWILILLAANKIAKRKKPAAAAA